MPYNNRGPYTRRYDEEEERLGGSLDRGRYESGRYLRDPSRTEYSGRDFDREREHETYVRNPYQSGYAEGSASSSWQRGARENAILVRLSDTDFDIPDRDDVRGRTLIDQNGNDLGDVDDLIIDQAQRRVRFLLATSGGFLGIGGTMLLIPIEAVSRVTNKVVAIDQKSTRGFRSAVYNPNLIDHRTERGEYRGYERVYGDYSAAGHHRGRGPRGYRRSDDRIKEDINDRLSDHGDLDASDIEVTVVNAEVTLSGMVNSRRDKRLAEDIAEDVSGVQNVENHLRVKQIGLGASTDRYDVQTTPTTSERPNTEPAPASRGKSTGT